MEIKEKKTYKKPKPLDPNKTYKCFMFMQMKLDVDKFVTDV